MPRDPKAYEEDDEALQDLKDAPQVDEQEVEEDERAVSSLYHKGDKHSEYGDDDEDLGEDIDLDDLAAMEGPDA